MKHSTTIRTTAFAPSQKPLLIWDGHCGFCAWWVAYWEKITEGKLDFETSQQAQQRISDISEEEFRAAVFLLETDGRVHQGAAAAYRSLDIAGRHRYLFKWYQQSAFFKKLSDRSYQLVAQNRPFFFKLTKLFFGSDPHNLKPFWVIYILLLLYLYYYAFHL